MHETLGWTPHHNREGQDTYHMCYHLPNPIAYFTSEAINKFWHNFMNKVGLYLLQKKSKETLKYYVSHLKLDPTSFISPPITPCSHSPDHLCIPAQKAAHTACGSLHLVCISAHLLQLCPHTRLQCLLVWAKCDAGLQCFFHILGRYL